MRGKKPIQEMTEKKEEQQASREGGSLLSSKVPVNFRLYVGRESGHMGHQRFQKKDVHKEKKAKPQERGIFLQRKRKKTHF